MTLLLGRQSLAVLVLAICTTSVFANQASDLAAIKQRLLSQFTLTQGDNSGIQTPGTIAVLKAYGLILNPDSSLGQCLADSHENVVKGGIITQPKTDRRLSFMIQFLPAANGIPPCPQHIFFGNDEGLWVTNIDVTKSGITFYFLSDPYEGIMYSGPLKFVFEKGPIPSPDQATAMVAEVLTPRAPEAEAAPQPTLQVQRTLLPVQPNVSSGQPSQGSQGSATAPQSQQNPSISDIPAPPSPTDTNHEPPTISLGETKDQVIAAFGQPDRIANLGVNQILFYQTMKVTLTNGKVTNVE
jgi:hypothetical protein